MATNEYIRGVKHRGWTWFRGRLWQRNYYERVIRDEDELNAIRQYVADNPARWAFDRENPDRLAHTTGAPPCAPAGGVEAIFDGDPP